MTEVSRAASPTAHITAAVLVTLLITIVTGTSVARTEIIAKGQGRVVPASRVQAVQPQVSGRIATIEVLPGDAVAEGQPLVKLATTDAEAGVEGLRLALAREVRRIVAARAALAATEAKDSFGILDNAQAVFDRATPDDGAGNLQRELLTTEIVELTDGLAALDADALRVGQGVAALTAQVEALRAEETLASTRLNRAVLLRDRGAGTQATLEEAEAAERVVTRQIVAAERAVDERRAEGAALTVERDRMLSAMRQRQAERLEAAEAERARLTQELRVAEQDLADRTIRAPRAGRVADLAVFTVGGRVEAGERLMTIVPEGEELIIEAAISNRDVGFVKVGQVAQVQFDAFPFERYGAVAGRIVSVASDARREEITGTWNYPIEVRLTASYVEAAGQRLPVQPGMTATVNAVTGNRRYISFVFEPIIAALAESFTER